MDSKYDHTKFEKEIYELWEKGTYFSTNKSGKPYTILMPPPNANASLHAGHAMYSIDDILIRWKRMQGFDAQWLPGMDHAGFETQYVYEKNLAKEGKSRMDFDRETLYKNVFQFVKDNSGLIYNQMKRLGFSANWKRSVFTLDDHVIKRVFETFKKMESEGLVYRDSYLVNYCTHCGTSLADLEVVHTDRIDTLYYIKYRVSNRTGDESEYITIATVRPETIFLDTHVAINPNNKKTKWLNGKQLINPISEINMAVIEDDFVDPDFGTGIVKLTPAHDQNDFQAAKKHNLPIISGIGMDGKIVSGTHKGLYAKQARKLVVEELTNKGLIDDMNTNSNYNHSVSQCYKCKNDLEPMVVPNWFIKVNDLKKEVIKAVNGDRVKFHPKKFKRHMISWLEVMHDWPISRQIAWGIRIPVWYDISNTNDIQITFLDSNNSVVSGNTTDLLKKYSFEEIEKGLQSLSSSKDSKYIISQTKPSGNYLQETDTFDTWFSSGQWPLVTLKEEEFESRFPTDVIGTLSDILKFWISRMIMFSLYIKNEIPFKDVYLWSMVADSKGVKMSKSKGNVINPIDLVDKYGADALRMALVYGVAPGAKVPLSEDKVRGMRNFANKIWNMGRFMNILIEDSKGKVEDYSESLISRLNTDDKEILDKLKVTTKIVTTSLEKFKFSDAAESIYQFMWHEIADSYIEKIKSREDKDIALSVLRHVYINSLKLLHPFMPFVTESIWQNIPGLTDKVLITSSWPDIEV